VPEQIDRLFRGSGLYLSDKWEREDYKRNTINTALIGLKQTYQKKGNQLMKKG